MVRWVKQNIILYVLNFKKEVFHMSIHLFIQNEATYMKFIEQTINGQLPDSLNDPELLS